MVQIENKKISKFVVYVILCALLVVCIPSKVSALTVPSLYGDMQGNNSTLENMVNYATRYNSFINSKYIAFRDSQNSYYLVWGDDDAFTISNNMVDCSNCEYVRYYRTNNTSNYEYLYTESDSLSVRCDYLVTTNLEGVKGFNSDLIDEWFFRHNQRNYCVLIGALIVFCGLFVCIRKG